MADRPIIFSAPMILALLAGRKTQTRRIIKAQPSEPLKVGDHVRLGMLSMVGDVTWPLKPGVSIVSNKPGPHPRWVEEHVKYAVGDRLYVRENHRIQKGATRSGPVFYEADESGDKGLRVERCRPSIHMPRWASRMTLIVTEVRVQRLQDISENDAWREGCKEGELNDNGDPFPADEPDPSGIGERGWECARDWFADLWEDINGDDSWEANPWVVAVSFEVVNRNIDDMPVAAQGAL
jgi:hypothetical protein